MNILDRLLKILGSWAVDNRHQYLLRLVHVVTMIPLLILTILIGINTDGTNTAWPVFILFLFMDGTLILSYLLINHKTIHVSNYIPILLFTVFGIFTVVVNDFSMSGSFAFILSILLAGILTNGRIMFLVLCISIASIYIGAIPNTTDWMDIIVYTSPNVFTFIGVALISGIAIHRLRLVVDHETKVSQDLRLYEQKMKLFIHQTPIGVVNLDRKGRILSWNPAMERIFGYSAPDAMGKTVNELIVPAERHHLLAETFRSLLHGKGGESITVEHVTRDNRIVQCEWFNSPTLDDSGVVIGMTCVVVDITEQVEANKRQKALYKISEAVSEAVNLDELYRIVHEIIGELIPAKNFFIAIYDSESDLIYYPYHVDERDEFPAPRKPGRGMTEYILSTGQPCLVDPEAFSRMAEEGMVENVGTPSIDWLGVPLKDKDRATYGILAVQTYQEGERYSIDHMELLTFVSNQVANAILEKQAEQKLRESEEKFRSFVEQTTDAVMIIDNEDRMVEINHSLETLTGYSREEIFALSGWEFVTRILPDEFTDPQKMDLLKAQYQLITKESVEGKLDLKYEIPMRRESGEIFIVQLNLFSIRTGRGYHTGVLSRDITEQKRIQEELRISEEQYRSFVEKQGEGIAFVNQNEIFVYTNPAAETIFGVLPDTLVGRNLKEFVREEEYLRIEKETEQRIFGKVSTYELQICREDQSHRTILVTATPQLDSSGNYLGSFGVFRDITERKQEEDHLRYSSTHDALTGIYNRAYFEDQRKILDEQHDHPVSVIIADVDDLKSVNDKMGHPFGDELLRQVAGVLKSAFRGEDTVARIGGDEFAVLLPGADSAALTKAMERIQMQLDIYHSHQPPMPISISFGGATSSSGEKMEQIIQIADENMFIQKAKKKISNRTRSTT